jgi:hypothetical protein
MMVHGGRKKDVVGHRRVHAVVVPKVWCRPVPVVVVTFGERGLLGAYFQFQPGIPGRFVEEGVNKE